MTKEPSNLPILIVFFTLLLLCHPFFTLSATKRCNPNDKKVLLQIKKDLNNPYDLASWDPNTDCCDWYVVDCGLHNNRIVQFQLTYSNISGQIPAAIGDLPYLDTLILSHIPNLTGTIPSAITKLKKLTDLSISNTNLTGPLPTFLTQLTKLTFLDLSFNNFSGTIPPSYSQFQNLLTLQLDRNKLTGTIPDSLGKFTGQVPDLDLSHNQLTGSIPKTLGNLNFTSLYFSRNHLTGDASFLFGKNKTVQIVDLSRNAFDFDLSSVSFPDSLTSLDLNHNKITGSLSGLSLSGSNLYYFNASYNRLCGQIPSSGALQSFSIYEFFHNKCLCGAPLPACKSSAGHR